MSSTANPTRTEAHALASRVSPSAVATAIAALILTVLLLSFRPFQPAGANLQGDSGDILNQLGYGTLGALALFCLATLADRRKASALLSPWWLAMLGFLAFSVLNALDPNAAMRTALFTLTGMIAAAAAVTLPRDGDGYATMFAAAGLVIVGLSYGGLVVFPDAAIHGANGAEPEHAGLWRGAFSHKNIAGPVMACFSFLGLYLWRHGWRRRGAILSVLALIFVINTGSKTTAGLVPIVIFLVMVPRAFGLTFLTPVLVWAALVATGLATIGIVFIEPLTDFAASHFPQLTYTGRTTLWAFLGDRIAERPWTGWGYESLWGSPRMDMVDTFFDQKWDVSGSVHGHDGWLDLAALMGLPALAVAIVTFVVAPLRDFARTPPLKENVFLADLFLMILVFAALNAFLESFFFHRVDPVWLLFVMAALGLRITARFTIPARKPADT